MEIITSSINEILPFFNFLAVIGGITIALHNLRKLSDSRKIETITNLEGQVDNLLIALMHSDPSVIRAVMSEELPDDLSDSQVSAYVYYYEYYTLVSRIHYFLNDSNLDVGMPMKDRKEQADIWIKALGTNKNNPALQAVHRRALTVRDFHENFLLEVERVVGKL